MLFQGVGTSMPLDARFLIAPVERMADGEGER
jgi:hypothetical protein